MEKNHQAAKYITRFSDWEQALLSISELAKEKKIVVVIDEFPYMVKGNNAITPLYVSRMLNVPLDEVEKCMKEMGV